MNEKMKRFLDKPREIKIIKEEIKPEITNILNESVHILSSDKEQIFHLISHPGNKQYLLKSYVKDYDAKDRTVVLSRKSGNLVLVTYNAELEELTDVIVEMCDKMGWRFSSMEQEDTGIMIMEIFLGQG